MPDLRVLVCLLFISSGCTKRCRGRFRSGLSSTSVCNYATGEWETVFGEAYAYVPDNGDTPVPGEPCLLPGVYLTWHNGDPVKEVTDVSQAECEEICRETEECDAWTDWTLNTRNNWCALKRGDQVKEKKQQGFVAGKINC